MERNDICNEFTITKVDKANPSPHFDYYPVSTRRLSSAYADDEEDACEDI